MWGRCSSKGFGTAFVGEELSAALCYKILAVPIPPSRFLGQVFINFQAKVLKLNSLAHHSNDSRSWELSELSRSFQKIDFIKRKKEKWSASIQADLQNSKFMQHAWLNFSFTSLVQESILAWNAGLYFFCFKQMCCPLHFSLPQGLGLIWPGNPHLNYFIFLKILNARSNHYLLDSSQESSILVLNIICGTTIRIKQLTSICKAIKMYQSGSHNVQ